MLKKIPAFLFPVVLFSFQSCAPSPGGYSSSYIPPVYSVYRPPVVVNFDDYHSHGEHHHHHDDEKRSHYHPNNQWDKIAYDAANKGLSSGDIAAINQLGSSTSKKSTKKR